MGTAVRLLAIAGSPRKQGNSDLLADRLLEAARARGAQVRKEYVVDWDIHPVCDPTACSDEGAPCSAPDSAGRLVELVMESDVVVFATPLYWYGPPAQLKTFIDRRFRPTWHHSPPGGRPVATGRLQHHSPAVLVKPRPSFSPARRSRLRAASAPPRLRCKGPR
ncbi:MAG: flavodoxin family protein [Acetobacteraceae bacterium]|nr:flavodoxin family protein [Acetobacteraceae bacterium]